MIRGQVTLLDRKKVGLNTQIFAEVKLNAHGRSNFTEFTEAIRGFPEVLECYVLMGAVDFLLRIVTSDIEPTNGSSSKNCRTCRVSRK